MKNDHTEKTVAVIGAGVVGLCCSIFLQLKGYKVKILDPTANINKCSYGNAGIIAVSEALPVGRPDIFNQLHKLVLGFDNSFSLKYRYIPKFIDWACYFLRFSQAKHLGHISNSLIALLEKATNSHLNLANTVNCRNLIHNTGWLKVYSDQKRFKAELKYLRILHELGVKCTVLSRSDAKSLVPQLTDRSNNAVYFEDCKHINTPNDYLMALTEFFKSNGGKFINSKAMGFEKNITNVRAVLSQTEVYQADYFVIAAGAYSKSLLHKLSLSLPLDTERGYHQEYSFNNNDLLSTPLFWADEGLVISPMNGSLRITSGVEISGVNGKMDFRQLNDTKTKVKNLLNCELGEVVSEWMGCRPSMPDSLPVISKHPKFNNVFLAFGHGHLGLTLGPITGEIISDLVMGAAPPIDISPYSASRF